jgi:hypothetical protein
MLAGLVLLSGAGIALGDGLHRIVTGFGISPSLLGTTALAATVEIEEVSRVAVSARYGRGDTALGNIFGTIAHFAAFNAGIIALVRPIHLDSVNQHLHLSAAAASTLPSPRSRRDGTASTARMEHSYSRSTPPTSQQRSSRPCNPSRRRHCNRRRNVEDSPRAGNLFASGVLSAGERLGGTQVRHSRRDWFIS